MSSSTVQKIAGLFAIFVGVSMAVPSFAQTGGLTGKATKMDGTPCVKCLVTIDREEIHATYKTKTDKKGEYIYIGLPIGMYKVTLFDTDGKSLFYIEQKVGMGNPEETDFDLPKLMAGQQQGQQQDQAQEEKAQQRRMKSNPEYAKQIAAEQQAQKEAQEKQEKAEKAFSSLKALFDQGNALFQQNDFKGAAAAFEKAVPLAKNPKNLSAVLSKLAESYQKAKEYPQAVDAYQKAIAQSPDDAGLHNNLGTVYADTGKFPEAQAEFEKAAQLDPTHASRYYFNVGAIMYNAGKMDAALEAFKKVIAADPQNAEAYFLEGQSLMGKVTMTPDGKVVAPPGTVEAFETYLKLEPNGPNAPTAKAILQTLQGGVETRYKKKGKS
jgi:tetratricopeptide (TPR) repeat protein